VAEATGGRLPVPPATLTVSDGRYVRMTMARGGFYDLRDDDWVEQLPGPAVTHLVCDLNALWDRLHHRLPPLGGSDADPADRPPLRQQPGPDGPGHADG